jgi:hypothetical protein
MVVYIILILLYLIYSNPEMYDKMYIKMYNKFRVYYPITFPQ